MKKGGFKGDITLEDFRRAATGERVELYHDKIYLTPCGFEPVCQTFHFWKRRHNFFEKKMEIVEIKIGKQDINRVKWDISLRGNFIKGLGDKI